MRLAGCGREPLSAFFADNDIIAAACIRALKSRGYRIPQDVSVIGFDDMPVCTMIDPTLTTIRVMKEQLGMTAMEILHQRITNGEYTLADRRVGVYRITISTHLVERESVVAYRT
ncbi:substrate-binding domain-containing protein [Caproicibacter fermentans]|uniref:Substrate-binding domain-containing protein n=1 Tax=Caproicibacter fermentans TaxID=2576756 RepID=A0A7G8TEW7_9FIRM|nr:substrate-binding domain-containing protein [Caproicibacter fermentans]